MDREYTIIIEPDIFEGKVYYTAYAEEIGRSYYGVGEDTFEALGDFYKDFDDFLENCENHDIVLPDPRH